jgi:hypothetical protein
MCRAQRPPLRVLNNRTARAIEHGPPGVLFGIDQEVVTLRGLYGNSGFERDLNARRIESKLTGSVRAVASGDRPPEAPLRATSSKSQPPHLVF